MPWGRSLSPSSIPKTRKKKCFIEGMMESLVAVKIKEAVIQKSQCLAACPANSSLRSAETAALELVSQASPGDNNVCPAAGSFLPLSMIPVLK